MTVACEKRCVERSLAERYPKLEEDQFAEEARRRSCTFRARRGEGRIKIFRRKRARTQSRRNGEDDKTRGEGSSLSAVIATTFFGPINLIIATVFAPRCYVTVALPLAPRFSPAGSHPWSHVPGEVKLPFLPLFLSPRVKRARPVSTGNRSEIRLPPAFREKLSRYLAPCPSGTFSSRQLFTPAASHKGDSFRGW